MITVIDARAIGRLVTASALTLVGYIVVAVSLGADFEGDLEAAAEREDVAVNQVSTAAQAQITHDHPVYALLTGLFLFVPPLLLLLAARRVRRQAAGPLSTVAWWSTVATSALWWAYVALGLGLFADPDDLPPLVRDFGPLTVPVVTTFSMLALVAVVLLGESVRRHDRARRAARVATVVGVLLGALSLIGLVTSGAADPVPPILVVPGALIVGIALWRTKDVGTDPAARQETAAPANV
ncbi:hypothetical protein F0U44_16615 [Nocardioides humilatus]|uniref:DUF4386 family protein n=1 Tax=Nocardioides humilatus TaxID=2607660 RepID=A0A5B1LAK1_9ACTN|nr:hypothetical protein [Nocardioides humilatus]KAA1416810.1 hypothetical protein F0U44_16615 [Nocardioides humilatus]